MPIPADKPATLPSVSLTAAPLAAWHAVVLHGATAHVPSHSGPGTYAIRLGGIGCGGLPILTCSCPHFRERLAGSGRPCKHILQFTASACGR
jgi:hypothetical protein